MIVLGLILLIVGFVIGFQLLIWLGLILLLVGIVLLCVGHFGPGVGGRRYWY